MGANKLYLECNSGISGDMFVAAMLDLGASYDRLKAVLDTVPIQGFEVKMSRKTLSALDVCDFDVILEQDNHDHDMEYLHGSEHEHHHDDEHHNHDHHHEEEHHHDHHHGEDHHHEGHVHGDDHHHEEHDHHGHSAHHHHAHEHRNLSDVYTVIDGTDMSDNARNIAKKIFDIIAEAESKAHGIDVSKVHFHEVGAIDSIVDIISAAVCLDDLNINECIVTKLAEGQGFVRCQHGEIPIPVPAVVNITSQHDIPLQISDMQAELVTPTGAAIVAAIRTKTELPENIMIKKTGYGGGKREYKRPSILRAMLIDEIVDNKTDVIYKLEANIDDCSGEVLGYAMDRLFEVGALDASYMPCFMKKNRPGYVLTVIAPCDKVSELESVIFAETTTIGIRKIKMERSVLERRIEKRNTSYGEIEVKVVKLPDGETRVYPEYESVKNAALSSGVAFMKVYNEI